MAVTLPQLRVFAEVAELGNIRDAAARLGRTPSAISMSLKQLEEELGGRLFEADRKSALTALGRYALSVARPELLGFDRAVEAIRAYAHSEFGRLDVACVPSVASQVLPKVIGSFLAERSALRCDVRDSDSANVLRMVEEGEVELGIAGVPQRNTAIAFEPLFRDDFVLVCRPDSPLAVGSRALSWTAISQTSVIANGAMASIDNTACRDIVAGACLTVRNVLSLLAMVRAGLGVTLLPRLSIVDAGEELAVVDIDDPDLYRIVGLLTRPRTELSPAAHAFSEILFREVAKEMDLIKV